MKSSGLFAHLLHPKYLLPKYRLQVASSLNSTNGFAQIPTDQSGSFDT